MIQVTNINTCLVNGLNVTHRFTCPNGTVHVETQTLPIQDAGIFIGKKDMTTLLTDYNCVLPGALYNGPCTVYSSGIVRIDKDFTFSSANVRVEPGLSGFDVTNNFTINQNTLVSGNTEPECNCLWRGIYVYGAVTMTTDTDASIQDALYAIRAYKKNKLSIKKTLFAKNFVGIRGTDGQFNLLAFEENRFDGLGPLKEICSLEPLKEDIVAPSNGNVFNQPISPVLYSAERGFAGMYLERYSLNLTPLPSASQNLFTAMAYGIMTYDGNVNIDRNSIFSNIAAGAYLFRRTAGVLFVDRPLQGPNTFLFTGNRQSQGGNIDFQNCIQGMHVRSEQFAAPTQIGITYTKMSPVRTGIYLDARFGGGEFAGASTIAKYIGVKNNQIDASIVSQSLVTNAGISFHDFSPGVSNVEISNNIVNMSYPFTSDAGGAIGITAHGLPGTSDPGPGVVEVDIYENRVTLSNGAENGIGFAGHPNGWIRNNAGGDVNGGNGVFVINGDSWSGLIANVGSNNNLIACNEVTVLSNVVAGQLSVDNSQNGQFLRNTFTGPGNGAHFEFGCLGSEYRCNDMSNNTVGLLYDNFAETGDQGTPTVTNGNRWFGPFSIDGAVADMSINVSASEYYYRNINNEAPPSINPLGPVWFIPAFPNATTDCILSSCPVPPPPAFTPEYSISSTDSLIAEGLSMPFDAPFAIERTWQHEFYLWNKIKNHSYLAEGNVMVQNYIAGLAGSNIEAFGAIQSEMRSALTPSTSLLSDVQSNMTSIQTLQMQIWEIDSLLGTATAANEIETLTQQRSALDSILSNLIVVQETVVGQFETQRLAAIPGLLAQVSSMSPANICETNLQRVYEIYLLTNASKIEADSSLLAELEAIAMQCPLQGGPGASIAGILYQSFTGILPVKESCEETAERSQRAKLETRSGLALYPNPNRGSFTVSIPDGFAGEQVLLKVRDGQGRFVRNISVQEKRTITLDLVDQPSGLYFISLTGNGMTTEVLPFIIQH
ncbi:MAG: T9SS type A sorting domain-containing protein [Saprospiraceae bacterium]